MDFVALDFETANEKRNSACAIGLTTVHGGEIVETISRLIRPKELRFSFWTSRIHRLSEDAVRDSPTLDELWPEILPLVQDKIVVAHNASFDISVLRHSLYSASIPIPRLTYLCSLHLSRSVWPDLLSHSLGFLAGTHGIELDHHDAGSDSRATAEIILRAMQATRSQSIQEMAEATNVSLGELLSAEDWIPSSSPSFRRDRSAIALEVPDDFDKSSHEFYGKNIVFTGELKMFSRKLAHTIVEQLGGVASGSVNKKSSYLVTGNQDVRMLAKGAMESSKLSKAKALRESGHPIRIISESDFTELILSTITSRVS